MLLANVETTSVATYTLYAMAVYKKRQAVDTRTTSKDGIIPRIPPSHILHRHVIPETAWMGYLYVSGQEDRDSLAEPWPLQRDNNEHINFHLNGGFVRRRQTEN